MKKLPKKNKMFYISTGFGIKPISIETIKNNFRTLMDIARETSLRKTKLQKIEERLELAREAAYSAANSAHSAAYSAAYSANSAANSASSTPYWAAYWAAYWAEERKRQVLIIKEVLSEKPRYSVKVQTDPDTGDAYRYA